MDDFIGAFREEASGLIQEMEEMLLKLEQQKDNNVLINEVFRVMHTLKGTSAMFGFENIGKLTHHVENVYDLAREGKTQISESIVNLTLRIADHIKLILNKPEQVKDDKEINAFIEELNGLSEGFDINKKDVIKNIEKEEGFKTFYIVFKPTEQILFRGINILNIFRDLSRIGNYKIIQHFFKDKKNEKQDNSIAWGIYLVSKENIEEIEGVFMFVIEDCNIIKVADFNIFNNEEINNAFDNIQNNTQKKSNTKSIIDIVDELQNEMQIVEDEDSQSSSDDIIKKENAINENKRINVDSEKLDNLMNLVSDLVTSNAILSIAIRNKDFEALETIEEKFERLTRQFRDNALSIRLVSIRELLLRFKRLVRDLSKELGKEIQFIIEGEETEMDKNIIDNLSEPLIHLFRNAIDHGIETPVKRKALNKSVVGTIKLAAFYSGTNVYITIQDDGAGINLDTIKKQGIKKGFLSKDSNATRKEILNLLFKPGFSTAKKLTGISGRGVGLDVVKNKITELQGEIEIDTEVGLGTTFTIKLQQTISIIDSLLIRSGESLFLIPQPNIMFCVQENYKKLYSDLNKRIEYEENVFPYINLREIFNNKNNSPEKAKLIIVDKNNFQFAIVADEIIGEHQAVIKPLGNVLKRQDYFTGVSLLGDGSLAFMIDLARMQEYAISRSYSRAV